jgi:hypothetical protein
VAAPTPEDFFAGHPLGMEVFADLDDEVAAWLAEAAERAG